MVHIVCPTWWDKDFMQCHALCSVLPSFKMFVLRGGTKISLCIVFSHTVERRFAMPYALLCTALLQNAMG